MKYIHAETGEVWTDAQTSTSRTSNFYLLSHQEKVNLGWQQVAEPVVTISLAQKKQSKLDFVRMKASQTILLTYPEYKQINAALGIYPQSTTDAIKAFIQNVRSQVTAYEADIASATSEEDLDFEVAF